MRRGLVVFQAHNGDEFSGIQRVLAVLSRVQDHAALRKIDSAYDHKGTLVISWNNTPTEAEMASVEREWEAENEYLLEYEFPDGKKLQVNLGVTSRTPLS